MKKIIFLILALASFTVKAELDGFPLLFQTYGLTPLPTYDTPQNGFTFGFGIQGGVLPNAYPAHTNIGFGNYLIFGATRSFSFGANNNDGGYANTGQIGWGITATQTNTVFLGSTTIPLTLMQWGPIGTNICGPYGWTNTINGVTIAWNGALTINGQNVTLASNVVSGIILTNPIFTNSPWKRVSQTWGWLDTSNGVTMDYLSNGNFYIAGNSTINGNLTINGAETVLGQVTMNGSGASVFSGSFTGVGSGLSGLGGSNFSNQPANLFLAGPTNGSASTPAFRALTTNDLPTNSLFYHSPVFGLVDGSSFTNSWAHGLGVAPSLFQAFLVCTTNDSSGLKVGDKIPLGGNFFTRDTDTDSDLQNWVFGAHVNATNVCYGYSGQNGSAVNVDFMGIGGVTIGSFSNFGLQFFLAK